MQFAPITPNNEGIVEIKKSSSLSDTLVLLVTTLLLLISVCYPFWKAAAETRTMGDKIILSLTEADGYSTLLSSLFGRVNKDVPDDAYEYIKGVDEYRIRTAQSIEENNKLTEALYALVENFPRQLREGYRKEIIGMEERVDDLKTEVFPYIKSDTFLSDAVTEHHEIYPSFTDWLVSKINQRTSVQNLNSIQKNSYNLRKDIALLYVRINTVTKGDR